jgi:hypothetical protein
MYTLAGSGLLAKAAVKSEGENVELVYNRFNWVW